MIKKIRKHIRKHINRKKLEKIKKFTNPDVIKYTFYSIGAIISIAIQIINRTFKIKNFISNDYKLVPLSRTSLGSDSNHH